jgi:thymidine phosphorylase
MTTGTALARFDMVVRAQWLLGEVGDVPGETAQAAYERAYAAAGSPWLSSATAATLLAYAAKAPAATAAQRRERQYAFMTFMLGGPDGQVM